MRFGGMQADSDEGFEQATIGLAICLTVTLLYALLATAVIVYDCRRKLREKREKAEEREAALAHRTAVISSQTAASSAMKPRTAVSVAAAASSRPTVRFNSSSVQKPDISCQRQRLLMSVNFRCHYCLSQPELSFEGVLTFFSFSLFLSSHKLISGSESPFHGKFLVIYVIYEAKRNPSILRLG